MTVEWTGWPDVACPDCEAPANAQCHWYCPRYVEDPDDGYSFADAEDPDD